MQRGGGVIMHITSLPGPFGIGVMGEEAVAFAKQLRDQGMKYWQVLPFTYPGMWNSPFRICRQLASPGPQKAHEDGAPHR